VPPPLTVLPTQTRRERGPAHNRRPVPTALPAVPLGENGERVEQTIEHLHELVMAERVIPAVEKL
jgi:hypothetical protein